MTEYSASSSSTDLLENLPKHFGVRPDPVISESVSEYLEGGLGASESPFLANCLAKIVRGVIAADKKEWEKDDPVYRVERTTGEFKDSTLKYVQYRYPKVLVKPFAIGMILGEPKWRKAIIDIGVRVFAQNSETSAIAFYVDAYIKNSFGILRAGKYAIGVTPHQIPFMQFYFLPERGDSTMVGNFRFFTGVDTGLKPVPENEYIDNDSALPLTRMARRNLSPLYQADKGVRIALLQLNNAPLGQNKYNSYTAVVVG